jgi:hypothetical protein
MLGSSDAQPLALVRLLLLLLVAANTQRRYLYTRSCTTSWRLWDLTLG